MTRILVPLLMVLTCSPRPERQPTLPAEIFRYMAIGREMPFDSVVLGATWTSAAKYGASETDTVFSLPRGTFSGADAIRVRRTASRLVSALEFDYGPSYDLGALRRRYEESLGPAGIALDSLFTRTELTRGTGR